MLNLIDSNNIAQISQQIEKVVNNVPKQLVRLHQELKICDQETSDIVHMIELSNFHASKGYKLAKDLQITKRKRREIKDEIKLLTEIEATVKKNRPLNHQLVAINKVLNKNNDYKVNRTYKPKVRVDMEDKFDEIKQKERELK